MIDSVTPVDGNFSVFVVTRTCSEQLQKYYSLRPSVTTSEDLEYQGFYLPSHFASETTLSVAKAAIYNEPIGAPKAHKAEVVAAAKKDLHASEEIDGGGGYTIYGLAEDADRASESGYVPFELLEGAEVIEPIRKDEVITYQDVEIDTEQSLFQLRKLQNFRR